MATEPICRILCAETITELEVAIDDWLKKGWTLQGGPFVVPYPTWEKAIACQLMICPWRLPA